MRACRSAIFEKNLQNVCKPLNILTRFYECLLNPRSAIFEKKKNLFETFVQICNLLYTQISVSGGSLEQHFLDGGPQPNICNFGGP